MTEGLREFDDSKGRCWHCGKLIFSEEEWILTHYTNAMVHRECESEYKWRSSQI